MRRPHFHRTPQPPVTFRSQVDPQSRQSTTTFRMHIHTRKGEFTTLCSSVLARPSPRRTLWPDEDASRRMYAILLAWTSNLCQGLLQIVHHLFARQACVPSTLRTSQTAYDTREALEFYFIGFHREAPTVIFQLYSHTGYS